MNPHHICPRDWDGETAVIVASGPSTEFVDLSLLAGCKVVAVAHGYKAVPGAEVLVVGGHAFYKSNRLSEYRGPLIVAAQQLAYRIDDSRVVWMRREGKFGLSADAGALCGSESSVMLAINYAVHRGANRIVLLGCDGRPGVNGRRRIGNEARDTSNALARYREQEVAMESQVRPLAELGISIVNCSPGSALTIYPTASLEDALKC